MPDYSKNVLVRVIKGNGTVEVDVRIAAYPQVGEHWKEQLTGANARKWGRIWIDPSKKQKNLRRRDALWPFGNLYKGVIGSNLDECPGAMFVWETQAISHVEPCDARSNQDFGRDLYHALRAVIPGSMSWWEVRFKFH